ncbi:MAG: ThiF family adenylyltransferase [Desulfovibrio sp.]|nr:ThiF family adenylyltransferase [Desulfovibrio sp.]
MNPPRPTPTPPRALQSRDLKSLARETDSPRGGSLWLLAPEQIDQLAEDLQYDRLDVEQAALRQGVIPERYARSLNALTQQDQLALLESHVAMVGLGGLGGHLLELLARSGVGTLYAADGDSFEPSNLNRQLLATAQSLHQTKAKAAQARCHSINPSVRLHVRDQYLDSDGMLDLLQGAELAVDALGELAPRRKLAQACHTLNIPLVAGALAGWSGYVTLVRPDGIHPVEFMGGDDSAEKKLGCPGPTVSLVASLMAAEAINTLLGRPALDGRMLVVDLRDMSFETVTL